MRYHSYIVTTLAIAGSALARPDGVGGHHDHGGHHADHGAVSAPAPATGYQEPVSSYEAQPDPGYSAPATGYGQPSSGYGQPVSGYGAPSAPSGYETYEQTAPAEAGGLDLSTLLIPILIIAGLALLFPQVTTVDVNARRKRDVSGDESPMTNMIERVQDMYMAVLQSEECLERVACEVGGLAEDAGISKSLTKAAESFLPKKYNKMMKKFNHGKDCSKNNKCGVF